MVNPIPTNCNSINAYIIVKDARTAMDFYAKAFGGQVGCAMTAPDGSVTHGEVVIGNSTLMLSQENLQWGMKSAETIGGSPVSLHVYVEDCDAVFKQAIEAGCTEIMPVTDMFWGDRYGKVIDPYGFQWGVATHTEDLTEEELQKRGEQWFAEMAEQGESSGAEAEASSN